MKFLTSIWTFFNGHKTNIAAFLMVVAIFLKEVIVGFWHIEPSWLEPLIKSLDWAGMALGGVGLGHKMVKGMKTEEIPQSGQ